jgi:hypothetical protein
MEGCKAHLKGGLPSVPKEKSGLRDCKGMSGSIENGACNVASCVEVRWAKHFGHFLADLPFVYP